MAMKPLFKKIYNYNRLSIGINVATLVWGMSSNEDSVRTEGMLFGHPSDKVAVFFNDKIGC